MSKQNKISFYVCLLIILSMTLSFADELPQSIINHYRGSQSIYWKIRQITISPIFDKPETLVVEFFIERPSKMYVTMPQKQIYTDGETVWTYLEQHKQVQKSSEGHVFNPFDFVDSAQTSYKVISAASDQMVMKAIDQTMEPDSIMIRYNTKGKIRAADYYDLNGNKVKLDFIKETFGKGIPRNIFLKNLPKDVKTIDLDRE
jgi:outer membrane lipoprotein-sorting protein